MKKIIALLACLLITLVYPEIGCRIANSSSTLFGIAWMYIHHIIQLLLSQLTIILIMTFIRRYPLSAWGFTIKNWKWSVLSVSKFSAGWLVIAIIMNLLFSFENQIHYERSLLNITSDLLFDFIVTPLSEEIMFRGLIMGILLIYLPGKLKIASFSISYAILFSTLLFSLAHMGINYMDLSIDFNPLQLAFTFGLGLFYAFMREKTGSLLGPILAHGFSDGSITVLQLILL